MGLTFTKFSNSSCYKMLNIQGSSFFCTKFEMFQNHPIWICNYSFILLYEILQCFLEIMLMWKLTSKSSYNSLLWETPICFYILVLFTDNKWFDPPWSWYLINLATIVFTKFEISNHPTFFERHIWKFLVPTNLNLQLLNYITLRRNLPKNSFFTTCLFDLYVICT